MNRSALPALLGGLFLAGCAVRPPAGPTLLQAAPYAAQPYSSSSSYTAPYGSAYVPPYGRFYGPGFGRGFFGRGLSLRFGSGFVF